MVDAQKTDISVSADGDFGEMTGVGRSMVDARRSPLSRLPILEHDQCLAPACHCPNAMLASRCAWIFS